MPTRIGVGLAETLDTPLACAEAARAAAAELGGPADLCFVFAAAPHLPRIADGMQAVVGELDPACLLGCGATGVVGLERELESGAGLVVWAARLGGGRVRPFALEAEAEGPAAGFAGLPGAEETADAVLLLADPLRCPADALLAALNEQRPGVPVVGGLAGATAADGRSLLDGAGLTDAVAIGCLLDGVGVVPCVSQGATPVGPEIAVTEANGNVITELASRPALTRVSEVVASLDPEQREQAAAGLLVGIVIDENRPEHERGDFLVRPIVGADRATGAIAIGERVRVGQTLRLHVRDDASARADLLDALALQAGAVAGSGSAGALLFTCNGRGRQMFGVGDHDAGAVAEVLDAPAAGFFCAGEIGPVGGRNFLHGFTATLAVFPAA